MRKELKKNILVVFGITVIFFVIFFLYGLSLDMVLYPAILSLLFVITVNFFSLKKITDRHKSLSKLAKEPEIVISEKMPVPKSVIEEDYQELIRKVSKELTEKIASYETRLHNMDDYYATWVHQIKTPIASMKLNLQAEDSKQARTLLRNLKSIEDYVDMVMTYLRLSGEHTDYVIREENIKDIVKASGRKCATDFIEKKLSFSLDMEDEIVLTDKKWVSLVIDQILSNCIKYTDKGGVSISFDKETHTLCIADTGIGIDKSNLPRIFERGYTGFNGRGESHSSGIGLYICKSICDNLHIDIRCESEVGVGTKVYLSFPVTEFFGD